MKNVFKSDNYRIGSLAIAMCLFLTACNFFNSTPKTDVIDSAKVDTTLLDTSKKDSSSIDSGKINVDSSKILK